MPCAGAREKSMELLNVILSAVGGVAGLVAIVEFVANFTTIIDWIKEIFSKRSEPKYKCTESSEEAIIGIPNNLPASGSLIGRKKLIAKLCNSIDKNPLTIIVGVGGIGKSSLALETVKKYYLTRKKRHFNFDAIVWITAKNATISFSEFLDTVAKVMEYTGILQIADVNQKAVEVRQLFRKKRILLVVDNFETIVDENIAKFIENVCDNDRVIITTREKKVWGISYSSIQVCRLETEEGIALVKNEYQRHGLNFKEVSSVALNDLLLATDASPLAIKWAVGQIATTRLPIERIINSLKSGQSDVFETMFSSSWKCLDDESRAILYKMLFFSTIATRDALLFSSNLDELSFDICMGKLGALSLIEINGNSISNQNYGLHPLTSSFISKMKEKNQLDDLKLYQSIIAYYVDFCKINAKSGTLESYNLIELERNNIFRAIEFAKKYDSLNIYAVEMINSISVFLWGRGYWKDRINLSQYAVGVSLRTNDYANAILNQYNIGIVRFWQGKYNDAFEALTRCQELLKNTQDPICNALVVRLLALTKMPSADESIMLFMQVLELLNDAEPNDVTLFADWRVNNTEGYKAGIVAIYQEMGITLNRSKKYDEAIVWLGKSLDLAKSIFDKEGQAVSLSHLGFSYLGLGNFIEAKNKCCEGLKLAILVNRKSTIGRCYQVLAEVEYIKKRKTQSRQHAISALSMFEKLGMLSEQEQVKKFIK